MGQKQTWCRSIAMSALPSKADILYRRFDICFCADFVAEVGAMGLLGWRRKRKA
jgi:hypothetical protein